MLAIKLVCSARCNLPAPRFCATNVVVASATLIAGMTTSVRMRLPIPYAATAIVPKLDTRSVINHRPMARVPWSTEAGSPRTMVRQIMGQSGLKSARRGRSPCTPLKRSAKPMTIASACVESVAMAAPATPIAGIGPQPKMNSGSRAKLRITVSSTISIGTCTTPIPRISD